MSSMESLDKLQAELSGNVYGDAFHTLYKLSQDVSVEHSELMAQAMKWVHKEKVEPLEAENAKLRELCAGLLTGYECGHGELCKGCTWDGLGDPKTFPCLPRVKARELGVEVAG